MDEGLTPPLTQRISPRQWVVLDVGLTIFLAAASIGATEVGQQGGRRGGGWDVLRYTAIAAACLPLPLRRKAPVRVLGVVTGAGLVLLALGARGPMLTAVAFAVYSVAAASPRRTSLAAAAGAIAAIVVGSFVSAGGPAIGSMISGPPIVLVGWLAGENTRTRRAYIQGVAERATERERGREERSRRAAADERLRIARELHDVVAHTMSVVAVRSGVARLVMDDQPEEARRALEIIETTSRRALQEMRLLVGVLRQGNDNGADQALAPAPGLADVPGLLSEISQAGVRVDFKVEGSQRALPPGVDVSAYRIVQEALTNVVRHAGPAKALLAIRYQPDAVEVEVNDDGGARRPLTGAGAATGPVAGPGHGLVGMRERVALFGGDLAAGPTTQGFRVVAHLPTEEPAP